MRKRRLLLLCSLTAGLILTGGCQQTTADSSDSTNEALSVQAAENDSETDAQPEHVDDATVILDNTYWSGSNIRVRMQFDKDGNCAYGYVGKYDLQTTEDGLPILTFIYYADSGNNQMASSTFALRDNGDGTYSKTVYLEDEEPDFNDETFTTDLTLNEGTDGLMSGAAFEGIYLSSDGQYYTFHEDGTFAMETWMTYAADEEYIEIIGSDTSTLYTYDADEDYSKITMYKAGKKVMDLATEEAIDAAGETEASQVELPGL